MDETDVIIVGAGAAGLAASQVCAARGLSVLVLEAGSRPGGRAHTVDADGWPVDLGCGWLHSADRNPLVQIARNLGFQVDESAPPWRDSNRALGFAPGEHAAFRAAQGAFYDRLEEAALAPGDSEASRWLAQGEPWNPLINAVSTYVNGTEWRHNAQTGAAVVNHACRALKNDRLPLCQFRKQRAVSFHDAEVHFGVVVVDVIFGGKLPQHREKNAMRPRR